MYATVVIPTKNAMPAFRGVLQGILDQKTPWPFEILVIDSGSQDGTLEFVQKQDRVKLITIEPQAFGHSKTRNQAASQAAGEYVAFLTQDAEPYDRFWLANLVDAVARDEHIAGAFGKHLAQPGANRFTARDLERHFDHFANRPHVVDKFLDAEKYEDGDIAWRQFLHFFSNNNSCVRRSVWREIHFPDAEFAEDQAWAQRVIDAGYAKAFAPDAIVYHSHDYGIGERFKRSFDEARSFSKLFGYPPEKTVIKMARAFFRLSGNDMRWARNVDPPLSWTMIANQVGMNLATLTGRAAGSRHSMIPASLQSKLSFDARYLKKR